jgi:hypothetical protein
MTMINSIFRKSLMTHNAFRLLLGVFVLVFAATAYNPARAALLASYEFEGNLDDSSGNGRHGVAGSANGAGSFPQLVNDPQRGQVLQTNADGSSFVNMSGTVAIPNFAPQTSITMAAWVKRTHRQDASNFRYIMNLGANGNSPIATLGIHSNGYIAAYTETDEPVNNGDQRDTFGSVVIEGNAAAWTSWHHVAVVYDRATDIASTYVDGVLDTTNSLATVSDLHGQSWNGPAVTGVPATQFPYIGRGTGNTAGFAGLIDNVRLYNHALTAQEILSLVPEPSTVALALLAGLWPIRWSQRRAK